MAAAVPDKVPVPDPTTLTTEQLLREVAQLRDLFVAAVGQLAELTDEKFRAVAEKFVGAAERAAEQKGDTKAAVDAALQAAKELVALQTEASDKAIARIEAAFGKLIDALDAKMDNSGQTANAAIAKVESRLDRIEAAKLGANEQVVTRQASSASTGLLVGLGISALVALISLVGLIVLLVQSKP